jgi:hypothetical protein
MDSLFIPLLLLVLCFVFYADELMKDEPSKLTVIVYVFAAILATVAMLKMNGTGWLDLNFMNMAG